VYIPTLLAGPELLTAGAICHGGGALAHLQSPCDASDFVKKIGLTLSGYMTAGLTRSVREGMVEDWPSRFNRLKLC